MKLACYAYEDESAVMTRCECLNPSEIQISILVCEGLTNREIGKIVGASEQAIKNHLCGAFDKLGVWSRLELGITQPAIVEKTLTETESCLATLDRSEPIPKIALRSAM